jgi:RNA polymerase sigma-70 factor (ECF subfamily)
VLDARRRAARRPQIADDDIADSASGAAAAAASAWSAPAEPVDPALVAALASLTPDQREVVLLRFVADLSLDDVAKLTRRKVGAVKALQHRGLENLGRILPPSNDAV